MNFSTLELSAMPQDLAQAALWYAANGIRIFPVHGMSDGRCTCGNSTCPSRAKHPRILGWRDHATYSKGFIEQWWRRWPSANIGIPTGTDAGVVVIDQDGEIGLKSLASRTMPPTLSSITARGKHFFYGKPDVAIPSRAYLPGVDVKGEGGYVVAPPSVHASGVRYEWDAATNVVASAPSWLIDLVGAIARNIPVEDGESQTSPTSLLRIALDRAEAGSSRNETGFALACQLRDAGVAQPAAALIMSEYVKRVPDGTHSYTQEEATASLWQAFSKAPRASRPLGWPAPLGPDAFQGPLGAIVRQIEPHSESDPAALLLQLLAGFGNLIGRGAWSQVEATSHHTNLFVTVVGDTASARKGTSWDYVRKILGLVDDEWARNKVISGLGSGEGLIEKVKDNDESDEEGDERG